MDLYNLEKLVKIEVCDFYPSIWYKWKPKKTFIGITTQKEGIYCSLWNAFETNIIPKDLVLKNGVLYNKPIVTLYYESKIEKTYRFETLKEAIDFRDKVKELSKSKFIS